jgi:hypothetical protein
MEIIKEPRSRLLESLREPTKLERNLPRLPRQLLLLLKSKREK